MRRCPSTGWREMWPYQLPRSGPNAMAAWDQPRRSGQPFFFRLPIQYRHAAGQSPLAGLMFWFMRKKLSGSYLALIRARRSYFSGP